MYIILTIVALFIPLAFMYAKAIDYMNDHHKDYKGDELI
jgi:hypothetical protein